MVLNNKSQLYEINLSNASEGLASTLVDQMDFSRQKELLDEHIH
jgi:hypothetical protein